MTPLDLDEGDPARAEEIESRRVKQAESAAAEKPKRARSPRGSTSGVNTRTTAAQRAEAELNTRLHRTFDRIADALEVRQDEELAEVIREDMDAMSAGIVSLTRTVTPLRTPLLMFLSLVEPVMAFGRITRILFFRWQARRAAAVAEWEAQQHVGQEVAGAGA